MRLFSRGASVLVLVLVVGVTAISSSPSPAWAQDDGSLEDGEAARRERAVHQTMITPGKGEPEKVYYGVGLRLRYVFVPKALIELFIGEASSGVAQPGFGLEFVRRKGNFSMHIGIEHESISPDNGWWLEKGDRPGVPGEHPDFVEFDGLRWTTLDAEFVFLKELAKGFDLRYGAGFGLGIVHGEARQTDSTCPANVTDIQSQCMTDPAAAQVDDPADLPPVFPVVNILVGAQYRPMEKLVINLQGGMRSVFYFGLGTSYYF
jgi:hypothetical protein